MGNQQSSSSSAKWPAPAPRPKWKPCPVKAGSTRALMMQVEVETFENTTGLPLTLLPRDSDDSIPNTGSISLDDPGLHGNENGNGHKLTRQLSGLSNASSSLEAYGLAPLHGSSSAGSIRSPSDDEDDEEEYDYGDVSGVPYTRDPKRSPAFGKTRPSLTKQTRSSILSLRRNCTLLPTGRPSQKQQDALSTNTRGPPLEDFEQVITPPPLVKTTEGRHTKRRIRHLEADATAMLSTIGEMQGTIFKENLRIIEEDGLEEPIDMATICCRTLRRRGTGTRKDEVKGGLENGGSFGYYLHRTSGIIIPR